MMGMQEKHFWCGQDIELGEALELLPPPLDILMEDIRRWVRLGSVLIVIQEAPPYHPLEKGSPRQRILVLQ